MIAIVSGSCCIVVRRICQRCDRMPKAFSTTQRPLDSMQLKTLCSFVNGRCAYGFMRYVRSPNASSPRMLYGVGLLSFGSGSATGNPILLTSRHTFSSDALNNWASDICPNRLHRSTETCNYCPPDPLARLRRSFCSWSTSCHCFEDICRLHVSHQTRHMHDECSIFVQMPQKWPAILLRW